MRNIRIATKSPGTYEIERIWYSDGIELVIQLSLDWQLKYILQFKFKLISTCSRINGSQRQEN